MNGLPVELNEEFKKRVLGSKGPMDLVGACLLVSRMVYTDIDEKAIFGEFDRLAAGLKEKITGISDARAIARTMGEVLCIEEGFKGNSRNYYDPDNSYLNRVLETRTGIPITLSIVFMEVGRRAGVDVRGIGIPGHFLVGVYSGEGRIFVDPFHRGDVLDEEQCRRRMFVQHQGALTFTPRFLQPVDEKAVLTRLLRNLRGIYTNTGDDIRAFQTLEWILALAPHAAAELKARGLMYESLGAVDLAVKDLEKYLSLQPASPDAIHIRSTIDRLKQKQTLLH